MLNSFEKAAKVTAYTGITAFLGGAVGGFATLPMVAQEASEHIYGIACHLNDAAMLSMMLGVVAVAFSGALYGEGQEIKAKNTAPPNLAP